MKAVNSKNITAIIGLGNPGPQFNFTPHNIGFLILDQLCSLYHGTWQEKKNMLSTNITINAHKLTLIKPQTFMNLSGQILPYIHKDGIKMHNILVIHDEIDYPFGKINFKEGGSARGHNGLRSIISNGGDDFLRLRVGVGRPDNSNDIGNFVTTSFQESDTQVQELIQNSIEQVLTLFP